MKTTTIYFRATMSQLYQVMNYYRETKGINIVVYNVRRTESGNVKLTTALHNEQLIVSMMDSAGYPIDSQ